MSSGIFWHLLAICKLGKKLNTQIIFYNIMSRFGDNLSSPNEY